MTLERTLQTGLARWLRTRGVPLPPRAWRVLKRVSRLERAFAFLESHAHLAGLPFVDAALAHFAWRALIDPVERERIPESGRVVLVANHPLGAVDALALIACVAQVRRDVRIVANDWLAAIEGLAPLLLPMRVFGGGPTRASLAAVDAALAREEAVIVFPAGEVSRLTPRGVRDGAWREGFLRFAERAGAPVVPLHVGGRNSTAFYLASSVYKPLGTMLLAREAMAPRPRRIDVRVAPAIAVQDLLARHASRRGAIAQVRDACERARRGGTIEPAAVPPAAPVAPHPIAHAGPLRTLVAAVAAMPKLADTADGRVLHAGPLAPDSPVLEELARLREVAFRAVGEGTGRRCDRDCYDGWYEHVVLWDPARLEIAGAYRVARCANVLAARGIEGLYTSTLFELGDAVAARLPQAMELGRSFVQPSYWGTRALDELWLGIGMHLAASPAVRYLFGPVSISAALPRAARELLVAYYASFHGEPGAAAARTPFAYDGAPRDFGGLDAADAMKLVKENLRTLGAQVPTLYRQYVELCEPGGAKFLAFGVDAAFSHSVDGLVWIDLDRLKPRKRARWLPDRAAAPPPDAAAPDRPEARCA